MKNSVDFPLWKQLLCRIPRGGPWVMKASFWRGSFCRLVMCESQAYTLAICTADLLLNPVFLETPSSLNKSGSNWMISVPLPNHCYFGLLPQNLWATFFFLCPLINKKWYFLGILEKINIKVCFHREQLTGKTNASSFKKTPRCKLTRIQLQVMYMCA